MAYDVDQIVVPIGAKVLRAPKGTTGPVDVTAAWVSDFVDLGAVSDNGATLKRAASWEAKNIWQSKSVVKRILKSVDLTVDFELVQWTADNLARWAGGGTWAAVGGHTGQFRLDIASSPALDEGCWGFEWANKDGGPTTETFRLVIPSAIVTDVGDLKMVNSDWTPIPLTLGAQATDATPLAYLITDSAAVAATAA
jgi:hypothetical protein